MQNMATAAALLKQADRKTDWAKANERVLVRGVVNRAPGAWEELQRRYGKNISKRIGWMVGRFSSAYRGNDVVEEIRSEFYVALLTNNSGRLRAFDPKKGKLNSWLAMIAGQTAIRVLTQLTRQAIFDPIESIAPEDVGLDEDDAGGTGDGQIGARWIAHGI
jgi:hypothetical protein